MRYLSAVRGIMKGLQTRWRNSSPDGVRDGQVFTSSETENGVQKRVSEKRLSSRGAQEDAPGKGGVPECRNESFQMEVEEFMQLRRSEN